MNLKQLTYGSDKNEFNWFGYYDIRKFNFTRKF